MKRIVLLPVLALLLASAGGAGADASATRTVALRDITFKPGAVTIARGGSVRFVWRDGDVAHNVTSVGALRFRTGRTRLAGSYTVRFAKRGTYRYVCTIHFGMKGSITVR